MSLIHVSLPIMGKIMMDTAYRQNLSAAVDMNTLH